MLRPPLAVCYKYPLRTTSTVLAVAFSLFIPSLIALGTVVAKNSTLQYFESYEPIVYLDLEATPQQEEQLVAELKGLPGIDRVEPRSRETSYDDLLSELDIDSHKKMGLDPSIFPKSLKIKLKLPSIDYTSTFESLNNLVERKEVLDVDVPNTDALRVLNSTTYIFIFASVFAILSLIVGYTLLHLRLADLLDDEVDENRLLYTFGATPDALAQPTIVRGLVLGLVAGVAILILFGNILAIWYANAPMFVGATMSMSPWALPLVLSPAVASTALGFAAGLIVSRGNLGKPDDYEIIVLRRR